MLSFVHCADIHLGRASLDDHERFEDFGRSFGYIVNYALEADVDFFLISGDLFDRRNINARTLIQTTSHLKRLRDSGVQTIAIEGNHDRALRRDRVSWMNYLSQEGLLILLKPEFNDGRMVIKEWDDHEKSGAVYRIGDVAIYGLGYLGSMTARCIAELSERMDDDGFGILMIHAAIGKIMGVDIGAIAKSELEPLRGKISYIALGHLHRRSELDNWAFNPGAPECVDIDEHDYDKGFYHVQVNGESFDLRFVSSKRRDTYVERIDISGTPDAGSVSDRVFDQIDSVKLSAMNKPIVRISLVGDVKFNAMDIPTDEIRDQISSIYDCLSVEVVNNANLLTDLPGKVDLSGRIDIETGVLADLVGESPYAPWSSKLVEATLRLKEMTQRGANDDEIVAFIKSVAEAIGRE